MSGLTLQEALWVGEKYYTLKGENVVGWLVVLGLTALRDSISVYIGPSPREREKETRKDR